MKTNRATRKLVQKQTYNFEFEMGIVVRFFVENFIRFPAVQKFEHRLRFDKVT